MKNMLSQLVEQAIIEWLEGRELWSDGAQDIVPISASRIVRVTPWTGLTDDSYLDIDFVEGEYMGGTYRFEGTLAEFWFEVVGL